MLTVRASVDNPMRMVGSALRRVVSTGADVVVDVRPDDLSARRGRVCCDVAPSCASVTDDASSTDTTRKTAIFERREGRIVSDLSPATMMTGERKLAARLYYYISVTMKIERYLTPRR
jgi:hypothetical protein